NVVTSKDGASLFAAGFSKYGVFTGGKWTASELKDIHADLDSLSGIAIAGDGSLWVAGSKSLLFQRGGAGAWTPLDLSSLGEHFFFMHLSNSPTGEVYVTNGQHLVKLTPEKPEKIEYKVESGSWASYSADLAFNDKGHVLAASMSCELVRVDPANSGDQWTVGKGKYNCQTLQAVALDGQDRAWVSSREGLSVVGPDKTATEYPTSTVMELVGSYINDIVVVGNGPALPAAGPVRTAGVTGKVLLEGSAVANSKIEMCASPSWGGSQPCYESKVKFAGTTNDKGEFTFENVPIGAYTMAVEVAGKWQMYSPPQMSTEMKEGTTYDVGSVKLNAM
ncbi:MAG TPA: carboxypeptidase-like regulatory domain-containing protein, partial [Enhygromyxa sp.]|nr:carboxypeptidase-like regulatory domain-containing protein [Enhygromyxa sp.]